MKDKWTRFGFRKKRVSKKVRSVAGGVPRFSVYRSLKYISAQIIDDQQRRTIVAGTTRPKGSKGVNAVKNIAAAKELGRTVAQKALEAGVTRVVFDRGGYAYHGRIKALGDAAREAGLKF